MTVLKDLSDGRKFQEFACCADNIYVERRSEPRVAIDQSVCLTPLSAEREQWRQKPMAARLIELSAAGMKLNLAAPLAPGTPVRIEYDDKLILGEIAFCSREDPNVAQWRTGVRVVHVITKLASLQRLHQAILDEQKAAVSSNHPHAVTR